MSKVSTAHKDIGRANSHRVLKDSSESNLQRTPPRKLFGQSRKSSAESVTVKKWIDYSSKYGIGYTLSNGMVGVYFNDSTKILSAADQYFYYIQRIDREDIAKRYFVQDYPSELKKKVSLFNHFKGYLVTGN